MFSTTLIVKFVRRQTSWPREWGALAQPKALDISWPITILSNVTNVTAHVSINKLAIHVLVVALTNAPSVNLPQIETPQHHPVTSVMQATTGIRTRLVGVRSAINAVYSAPEVPPKTVRQVLKRQPIALQISTQTKTASASNATNAVNNVPDQTKVNASKVKKSSYNAILASILAPITANARHATNAALSVQEAVKRTAYLAKISPLEFVLQ